MARTRIRSIAEQKADPPATVAERRRHVGEFASFYGIFEQIYGSFKIAVVLLQHERVAGGLRVIFNHFCEPVRFVDVTQDLGLICLLR